MANENNSGTEKEKKSLPVRSSHPHSCPVPQLSTARGPCLPKQITFFSCVEAFPNALKLQMSSRQQIYLRLALKLQNFQEIKKSSLGLAVPSPPGFQCKAVRRFVLTATLKLFLDTHMAIRISCTTLHISASFSFTENSDKFID